MIENSETTDTNWIDEDDAPDLSTPEWVAKFNAVEVRRGRPPVDKPKTSTTIRLDADIIERFREGGPGWQSRINAALREWLAQR
jgi:uncharacterized protein (DUF4415 family)